MRLLRKVTSAFISFDDLAFSCDSLATSSALSRAIYLIIRYVGVSFETTNVTYRGVIKRGSVLVAQCSCVAALINHLGGHILA